MILVDDPVWPGRGRAAGRWFAHLVSDMSFEELHAFAQALGAPARAFERDHYDIPADLAGRAIALGAQHVASRELVRRLTAAGLRRPKRRGPERPNQAGTS
jgi:hypothetical protein